MPSPIAATANPEPVVDRSYGARMGGQLRHPGGNRVPIVVYGKDLVDEVDLVVKAGGAGEIRFHIGTTDGNEWTVSIDSSAATYLIHLLAGELFKTTPLSEFVLDS